MAFCKVLLGIALLLATLPALASGSKLTLYFVTNAPVACRVEQNLACLGGWLAVRAAEEARTPYEIKELPWKRAIADLSGDPNGVFIATGRTPELEGQFDWVVPVYTDETWLIRRKDGPADPAALKHIGVKTGSPFVDEARRKGWHYDEINDWPAMVRTLLAHRIDAVYATRLVLNQNVTPNLPESFPSSIVRVDQMTWWIARGRNMGETQPVRQFREAAERILQTEQYEARATALTSSQSR